MTGANVEDGDVDNLADAAQPGHASRPLIGAGMQGARGWELDLFSAIQRRAGHLPRLAASSRL